MKETEKILLSGVTFSAGLQGTSTSGRCGWLGKVTPTQGSPTDRGQAKQTHTLTEPPHTQFQAVADTQPIDLRCNNTQCEWVSLTVLKKEHTANSTRTHVHTVLSNSHISL